MSNPKVTSEARRSLKGIARCQLLSINEKVLIDHRRYQRKHQIKRTITTNVDHLIGRAKVTCGRSIQKYRPISADIHKDSKPDV
jgi:hypothetical protein